MSEVNDDNRRTVNYNKSKLKEQIIVILLRRHEVHAPAVAVTVYRTAV